MPMAKQKPPWPPERVFVVHPIERYTGRWSPAAFAAYRVRSRASLGKHGEQWAVAEYHLVAFQDKGAETSLDRFAEHGRAAGKRAAKARGARKSSKGKANKR